MGLAELLATTVVDESPAWLRPYLRRLFTADALAALLATVGASTLKVADALGLLGFVPPDVKHYYETHGRPSGYEAYRLGFDDAWDGTGEFRDYFSYDEAAFTSEVRFTDRIFSFHGAWRGFGRRRAISERQARLQARRPTWP
ncbi:hypothetical protein JL720_16379 [Aureococcus anophagefferens]|nr:hypothetical protein JL720_16379 [Aureococcus anophagefferens]